ncbi:MAG: glutaredoxin family protein [Burkholderiales bacterium]
MGLKLTLLTRAYCHLCDEMLAAVRPLAAARGATVAVVDVDTDPTLERAYGELVPVLFAGDPETGIELCHYHLDPARVERALSGAGDPRIEVASGTKIR